MKQLNIQIVDLNHESTQKQKLGRESSDTYWITWKSCENKLYRTNEASYRQKNQGPSARESNGESGVIR